MSGRRAENLLRDGESEALGSSLPSFGTGGLGGWDLVEQLHRECTVSDRCSSSKRGRQHRSFGDFFASGAGAFGCASVYIEAIRALACATAIAISSRYFLGMVPSSRPTILSNSTKAENSLGASCLNSPRRFRSSES